MLVNRPVGSDFNNPDVQIVDKIVEKTRGVSFNPKLESSCGSGKTVSHSVSNNSKIVGILKNIDIEKENKQLTLNNNEKTQLTPDEINKASILKADLKAERILERESKMIEKKEKLEKLEKKEKKQLRLYNCAKVTGLVGVEAVFITLFALAIIFNNPLLIGVTGISLAGITAGVCYRVNQMKKNNKKEGEKNASYKLRY